MDEAIVAIRPPAPGLVPLFERENCRPDKSGLVDYVKVNRDGQIAEITNFEVIQNAFRECIPPKRVWVGAAWTEEASQTNKALRERLAAEEITKRECFEKFVVGVYIQGL